eukprot:4896464-Amphidinium_carterae.1
MVSGSLGGVQPHQGPIRAELDKEVQGLHSWFLDLTPGILVLPAEYRPKRAFARVRSVMIASGGNLPRRC